MSLGESRLGVVLHAWVLTEGLGELGTPCPTHILGQLPGPCPVTPHPSPSPTATPGCQGLLVLLVEAWGNMGHVHEHAHWNRQVAEAGLGVLRGDVVQRVMGTAIHVVGWT